MRDQITAAVDAMEAELVDFRRDLHAHPELGFDEQRTTAQVTRRLRGPVKEHP